MIARRPILPAELESGLRSLGDAAVDLLARVEPISPVFWLTMAGALAPLVLAAVLLRIRRRRGRGVRPARARALAARGMEPLEIARKTGLSQDAVAMLMCAQPAQRSRPNLPLAARIADANGHRGAPRDWAAGSQVVAGSADRAISPGGRIQAHRLLDVLAQSIGIPRHRRAA